MKKIIAIMALSIATSAMADGVTVEADNVHNATSANQTQYVLNYKKDFNKTFAGDIGVATVQTDGTNAIATRFEAGVTGTTPLVGTLSGYTRVAMGQRFTTSGDYNYYLVEPGISAPVGPFTAKLGVRYRSAVDSAVWNDQTHTKRVSLSYPVNKTDSIMVGYDRVTGDSDQKTTRIAYTMGF